MFPNLLSAYVNTAETSEGDPLYVYDDVWTAFAKNALANVFLYFAIAALAILLVVGIFIRLKRPDAFRTYIRYAVTFAVGAAAVILTSMLAIEFYDMYENGYVFDLVLWPAVATAAAVILSVAVCYVAGIYSRKAFRVALIVCGCLCAAAFIALFVCLSVYFSSGDAANNNGVSSESVNQLALYLCSAGLVAAILLLTFLLGRNEKKGFDSHVIAYASICIALSFALSYLKLWDMPQGGAVTFASLLPLMIFSHLFGVKKGVFAGLIYGILQTVQDPWLIHPAQFLLDYPIAFAAIGLSGMFRSVRVFQNKPQIRFALGAVIAAIFRYTAHILSGVFAFSEYAGGQNPWVYSLGYNAFVFVDIAIVIIAGVLLFSSASFQVILKRYSVPAAAKQPAAESADDQSTVQPRSL